MVWPPPGIPAAVLHSTEKRTGPRPWLASRATSLIEEIPFSSSMIAPAARRFCTTSLIQRPLWPGGRKNVGPKGTNRPAPGAQIGMVPLAMSSTVGSDLIPAHCKDLAALVGVQDMIPPP